MGGLHHQRFYTNLKHDPFHVPKKFRYMEQLRRYLSPSEDRPLVDEEIREEQISWTERRITQ